MRIRELSSSLKLFQAGDRTISPEVEGTEDAKRHGLSRKSQEAQLELFVLHLISKC